MYPQDNRVQTEDTPFEPVGRKGRVRAQMATMVLEEMNRGEIPVLIARAPEFYGPGRTQGFSNTLIVDRMRAGKRPLVPVSDATRRSLIWTPDASRALAAVGNASDAYGQTWHLPVDEAHPTYREFVEMAAREFDSDGKYTVLPGWALKTVGLVSPRAREILELLARYAHDTIFDSGRFRARFPDFRVTSFREGLAAIRGQSPT